MTSEHATAEWLAPGDIAAVTAVLHEALGRHGGHVHGLDADYGPSAAYRFLGILVPGEEHRVPVHVHVDVRPGTTPANVLVRAEMRAGEGMHLLRFVDAGQIYAERFAEIRIDLQDATGVVDA